MRFIPRNCALVSCIDTSSILIAGGQAVGNYLKDSIILDTTNNSLKSTGKLPIGDYFANPSILRVANDLFALGDSKSIYKYSIEEE